MWLGAAGWALACAEAATLVWIILSPIATSIHFRGYLLHPLAKIPPLALLRSKRIQPAFSMQQGGAGAPSLQQQLDAVLTADELVALSIGAAAAGRRGACVAAEQCTFRAVLRTVR